MKSIIATVVLLMLSLFGASQASANILAGDLQEACPTVFDKSVPTTVDGALCIGYISGWIEGINGTAIRTDDGKFVQFKIVGEVSTKQIIQVFEKYMTAHPEMQNKDASDVLILALSEVRLIKFVPVVEASQIQ